MALFYDYPVQTPPNVRQVCSVWGEQEPVLAVALENHELHFFTDEVNSCNVGHLDLRPLLLNHCDALDRARSSRERMCTAEVPTPWPWLGSHAVRHSLSAGATVRAIST